MLVRWWVCLLSKRCNRAAPPLAQPVAEKRESSNCNAACMCGRQFRVLACAADAGMRTRSCCGCLTAMVARTGSVGMHFFLNLRSRRSYKHETLKKHVCGRGMQVQSERHGKVALDWPTVVPPDSQHVVRRPYLQERFAFWTC